METARVFWSGNSQAVRLPKAFRFPEGTNVVEVRKKGSQLILEPVSEREFPEEFWAVFGTLPEELCRPNAVPQRREELKL